MIYKTQECLKAGIELILKDPINYLSIVKFNFISTMVTSHLIMY